MSLTVPVTVSVARSGETVTSPVTLTGEAADDRDISATGSTTIQCDFAMVLTRCLMVLIVSDRDLTLKTNSSGSPADTITLKAGIPFFWQKNSGITIPFSVDITSLFFTNASATAANVKIRSLFTAAH